jgi:hypothetical protein
LRAERRDVAVALAHQEREPVRFVRLLVRSYPVISQSVYFANGVLSDLEQDIATNLLCLSHNIFGFQQVFLLIQRIAALLALRISNTRIFSPIPLDGVDLYHNILLKGGKSLP